MTLSPTGTLASFTAGTERPLEVTGPCNASLYMRCSQKLPPHRQTLNKKVRSIKQVPCLEGLQNSVSVAYRQLVLQIYSNANLCGTLMLGLLSPILHGEIACIQTRSQVQQYSDARQGSSWLDGTVPHAWEAGEAEGSLPDNCALDLSLQHVGQHQAHSQAPAGLLDAVLSPDQQSISRAAQLLLLTGHAQPPHHGDHLHSHLSAAS